MANPPDRLSGPVRRLAVTLLALGRIRLELLAVEVQEEKQRIASLLLWTVLTALMMGFGAVLLALLVTVALWDTDRLAALGGAAALFIAFALLGLYRMLRLCTGGSTLFQSSIAELQHDGTALRRDPPP